MSHQNRIAVVTGASSGIGAETALALGREGARVVLLARDPDRLAKVAGEIRAAGGDATVVTADITDAGQVAQVAATIGSDFGRVDYLVNCAGSFQSTPAGETALEVMDGMINTNLRGTMLTCNAFVPLMLANNGGVIVNIASVAAVTAVSGYSVYCATKAGVVMFSRALAQELASRGIRINVLAPGNTATEMNAEVRANGETMAAFASITPARRVFSPPREMAETILFLLSDKAEAFHGSVLVADEGLSLGV